MHEMVIKGGDGTTVRGRWWIDGGSVTVRSSHGQQKTMWLGGSTPRGLARLLLLLMEEERRGPVPPTPKEIKEADRNFKRAMAENRFNRMADYAARGRRFSNLSGAKLLKVWTAAHDEWLSEPVPSSGSMRALVLAEALAIDLDTEFEIRGIESPYQEYLERRWAERTKDQQEQLRKD
jgi:hypothetical protein